MKKLILIALAVAATGCTDMQSTADYTALVAVAAGSVLEVDAVPDDGARVPRSECTVCDGTGKITHGDGHQTPCGNCYEEVNLSRSQDCDCERCDCDPCVCGVEQAVQPPQGPPAPPPLPEGAVLKMAPGMSYYKKTDESGRTYYLPVSRGTNYSSARSGCANGNCSPRRGWLFK